MLLLLVTCPTYTNESVCWPYVFFRWVPVLIFPSPVPGVPTSMYSRTIPFTLAGVALALTTQAATVASLFTFRLLAGCFACLGALMDAYIVDVVPQIQLSQVRHRFSFAAFMHNLCYSAPLWIRSLQASKLLGVLRISLHSQLSNCEHGIQRLLGSLVCNNDTTHLNSHRFPFILKKRR